MENLPKALDGVWIVTYPVDKVVRSLNNWGQVGRFYPMSFQNCHIAAIGEKKSPSVSASIGGENRFKFAAIGV